MYSPSNADQIPKSSMSGSSYQGAKQIQEDSFFTFQSECGEFIAAGCFDGHGGECGKVSSNCASEFFSRYFQSYWEQCLTWSDDMWKDRLKNMFRTVHDEIRKNLSQYSSTSSHELPGTSPSVIDDNGVVRKSNGLPMHGGTTATVVVVIFDRSSQVWRCVTANVGDSDTILVSHVNPADSSDSKENNNASTETSSGGGFAWEKISVDHGPERLSEFRRIQQLPEEKFPIKLLFVYDKEDVNFKYECPLVFNEDGSRVSKYVENPWGNDLRPTNVRYDPAVYAVTPQSVYIDTTCIAMTRALGDFYAHQFGVTAEPDVSVRVLAAAHSHTILIGSDGVWDCWRYDKFSEFVHDLHRHDRSVVQTVQTILDETLQLAVKHFGKSNYDDATLISIHLDSPVVNSRSRRCSLTS
eukprot:222707_1